ncbi:MAG TPA: alpha/beta hydrolase [Usitatibacter sp.]|nr:alpha/beta hydrolase [Usitatibacter sp.]
MTSRRTPDGDVIPGSPGIRFVALQDGRIEVLDLPGSTPPLLLLHEGLGSVSMWRDFPHQLAAATGSRVVAYSRLGFGRSSARTTPYSNRFMHEEARDALPPLRAALGLDRPILVGHSTGASIALLHAALDVDGVAGVVAIAPLIDVEDGNVESILEARRIFETTAWRARLARHHEHPIEQVFSGWNDTWLDPSFRQWSIVADLAAVRCPILGIGGLDDPYSSPRQLDLIETGARNARRVELLKLPACGHVPYRDQPEAVLAAIAGFAAVR